MIHALEIAAALPAAPRALVSAKALAVAARLHLTSVVPDLLPAIAVLTGSEVAPAIELSVGGLRELGLRRELDELLAKLEPRVDPNDMMARIAIAGGWFTVGKPEQARTIIESAELAIQHDVSWYRQLEALCAIARAYANTPIEKAEPGLASVTAGFDKVTDNLGTNSHYCISVIGIVEAVVLGVVSTDARRGR